VISALLSPFDPLGSSSACRLQSRVAEYNLTLRLQPKSLNGKCKSGVRCFAQAEVMGQQVTWLVPHQLAQVLPKDVDYRVMLTFLEFYSTMLQFVLYKLYSAAGARYPPQVRQPKPWRLPSDSACFVR